MHRVRAKGHPVTHAPHHLHPRHTACGRNLDRVVHTDRVVTMTIAEDADEVECKKCTRVLSAHPRRDPWRKTKQKRRH